VFAQEFGYLYSEFPADHDPPAWKVLIEGPAIPEWDFTPQLRATDDECVMFFDHLRNSAQVR